jgi:hypothetical protein
MIGEYDYDRNNQINILTHKVIRWCAFTATLSLIPAGLLIYFWVTGLYQTVQLGAMLWLVIFVLLRLLLPFSGSWNGRFWITYGIWMGFGVFFFIWSCFEIGQTTIPPNPQSAVQLLIFITFVTDVINHIIFWGYALKRYREIEDQYPTRRVIPPVEMKTGNVKIEVVFNQPGINTHRFYNECVICTEKFKEDDTVKDLACKHVFHPACIDKWIRDHNNCPVCKVKICEMKLPDIQPVLQVEPQAL